MIDGIETRLGSSAPARIRIRLAALRQRAERARTRADETRVERSLNLLIERESMVTAAAMDYGTSILPAGLQPTFEKQILIKKMLGDVTPSRLTRRCS
jgi:ATP-dependent exoDNAse (exonuclease V) alpha subunit